MNRSPRRPLKIQPPLGNERLLIPVVRQRPPISSGRTTIIKVMEKSACDHIYPDWIAVFEKYPGFFKLFNLP